VMKLGLARPPCLSYQELLQDSESLARLEADVLRIDSPGENAEVAAALIRGGGGPKGVQLAFGEIDFLREYHRGFCQILDLIERRGLPCLNSPRDISIMFDKWACHRLFMERGVARPPAEMAPSDVSQFLEQLRRTPHGRLFLKPLHGSSASGVCALRWTQDRQQLIAPLRVQEERGKAVLVNSLDVRTYTTLADIEFILGILLPQGMISEQWIPKLTLPGGAIDLRVLVIAGEARHWVIRQSRHPMTNLHLGNRRGDEAELLNVLGAEKLAVAFETAEQAAACFPDSLYAGVDILIDSRHRVMVGEINAFGDLLPRLTHRGDAAYTSIAKAFYAQGCAV
jgi:glutathione synthase/RimK-type ligase-like ATP-grasp enzyme